MKRTNALRQAPIVSAVVNLVALSVFGAQDKLRRRNWFRKVTEKQMLRFHSA